MNLTAQKKKRTTKKTVYFFYIVEIISNKDVQIRYLILFADGISKDCVEFDEHEVPTFNKFSFMIKEYFLNLPAIPNRGLPCK